MYIYILCQIPEKEVKWKPYRLRRGLSLLRPPLLCRRRRISEQGRRFCRRRHCRRLSRRRRRRVRLRRIMKHTGHRST